MRKLFVAGALALALVGLGLDSAEAGCRRGGRGGCGLLGWRSGGTKFFGGHCSSCGPARPAFRPVRAILGHGDYHESGHTGGCTFGCPPLTHPPVEQGTSAYPAGNGIRVRDSQGRIYLLIPEN